MSQSAPRLHFLDSSRAGQISILRTLVDQMINHYQMDRCWQNKPGYLVDGPGAVSCLE